MIIETIQNANVQHVAIRAGGDKKSGFSILPRVCQSNTTNHTELL